MLLSVVCAKGFIVSHGAIDRVAHNAILELPITNQSAPIVIWISTLWVRLAKEVNRLPYRLHVGTDNSSQ
ncbi:MAG: hypothetical protein EB082_10945 [Verrucomicrobia bacterium]|nr:hypothetical protein [Verrucomicrobiota bacterium]NBU11690.1 hypothetical protein [Pseudomonadota bacterium]NDD38906.1 hypothetical protein [Verrucomicrobiota bacterium]